MKHQPRVFYLTHSERPALVRGFLISTHADYNSHSQSASAARDQLWVKKPLV